MDRIEGKTIKTEKELNEYFDKIMEVLNDLLRLGFLYKDINIDNFIIGDDNEVYLIDFEDVVPYEKDYSLIIENSDGSISLNNEYIKTALHESIHMKYIMKHTAGSNYKFSHKKSRFTKNRKNKPKNKPKNKSKNKRKKYKGCKTSKIYIKNL